MARICVLGGTGFIGQHLLNRLVADAHKIVVPTRRLRRARDLYLLPTVDVVEADIHDEATLDRLLKDCDAAVNLVGALHSRPSRSAKEEYGRDFARAHVELPTRLVEACVRAGIERLLHISALGASLNAPSEYLRSKAAGEAAILAARDRINATVFRPSVVFGPEDRFLNRFAAMQRFLPFVFLPCPDAQFQPVHVGDVARCIVCSLFEPQAYHRNYDLCGPKVYTLRELVRYAGRLSGHPRPVIGLSQGASKAQAWILEHLPGKLVTRDNVQSMKVPSVCHCEFPFGLEPVPLEAGASARLWSQEAPAVLHGASGR